MNKHADLFGRFDNRTLQTMADGANHELALRAQRPGSTGPRYDGSGKSDETRALCNWMRKGGDIQAISDADRRLIDFNRMSLDSYDMETKVMISSAADLGGMWSGSDMSQNIVQKLFQISPIRQFANVEPCSGEKLLVPSEGATDTSVAWSDEQSGNLASPDVTVGMIEIWARELNGYIKISRQNLEDQAWPLEEFLIKRLSRAFAKAEGTAFINGNGLSRPEGILTNAKAAGTGMNIITCQDSTNHTIKPEDVINCMGAIKSGYRANGVWLAHNSTINALRLFEDAQQRPLYQPFGNPMAGQWTLTLFGQPVIECVDMDVPTGTYTTYAVGPPVVIGSQAKFTQNQMPLVFCSLQDGYTIADRVGMAMTRLSELFAIQNQVAFLARQRVGGKVVLPEAFSVLKIA